jgi:ribokinase
MSKPIMVVGSLNADLVVACDALPRPGETVVGKRFHRFPGGKGANQAVAAARLGADVRLVGCVGDDETGRWLGAHLVRDGVDNSEVHFIPEEPTGVALITVDAAGQNTIAVVSGANGRCTPELVTDALGHLEDGILLLQLEVPLPAVAAAARVGRARGLTVILNPAPARPLPPGLLADCDYVIPNETEAMTLTGHSAEDEDGAWSAAADLAAAGQTRAIVTLGRRGAVYADAERRFRQPAWPVRAVDATAAGDAFVGAFAVALARGDALETALDFAASAGALTVTRLGAQASLPTAAELACFRAEGGRP